MSPRPRTVSDEEILLGTGRAIGRLGPARLTLADVAAEVGLAPSTLVQRFGSKRGLLLAFAAEGVQEVARTFAEARAVESTALSALLRALADMTRGVRTPEEMANHLSFLQMDLSDPAFHVHARSHAETVHTEIALLLRDAVQRKELATKDLMQLARAVQAIFNGALLGWVIGQEGRVETRVREDVETLLRPRRIARGRGSLWPGRRPG